MTNHERYVRAFSVLRPSENWMDQLDLTANRRPKHRGRRVLSVIAAAVLLMTLICVTYAANLDSIKGRIKLWHLGRELDLTVETDYAEYQSGDILCYLFYDETGDEIYRWPVAGTEGKTAQEIAEEMLDESICLDTRNFAQGINAWVSEDHSIYIHYFDRSVNIGDSFDENGYGYYEGKIWYGKYGRKVIVSRTEGEPGWTFRTERIQKEP